MKVRTDRFDTIIQNWLKSDNENTTYCAHLLAEDAEQEIKELKDKEIIKCYNCDYKGKMTSLGHICPDCYCDN